MRVVETVAKVRRLHLVQGLAIKAICRELGLSRKVVRKVLRSGATEFRYERTRQPMPKLGAWQGELDRLLEENAGRASRERLTLTLRLERVDVAQMVSGRRFLRASSLMRLTGWSAMQSRKARRYVCGSQPLSSAVPTRV